MGKCTLNKYNVMKQGDPTKVVKGKKLSVNLSQVKPLKKEGANESNRKVVDQRPKHLRQRMEAEKANEHKIQIATFRRDPDLYEIAPDTFVPKKRIQQAAKIAKKEIIL